MYSNKQILIDFVFAHQYFAKKEQLANAAESKLIKLVNNIFDRF